MEGCLELDHIDANDVGVEAERISFGHQRCFGQRFTKDVGRDLEQVASALEVAFGPQRRDEPIACNALPGREGQQREQGDAVPLRRPTGNGRTTLARE